jgi:hypothetical protein
MTGTSGPDQIYIADSAFSITSAAGAIIAQ